MDLAKQPHPPCAFMNDKKWIGNLSLMLITDRSLCKQPLLDVVQLALKGGMKTVQLRERGLTTYELYSLACEMRKITLDFGANLIINDRIDIALAVEADGVHLGWQSLPIHKVRELFGFEKLIGVSTHNRQEALRAQDCRADYITFGPVFPTPSKVGLLEPVGPEEIQKIKNEVKMPVIALGGIHGGNVETVLEKGADGIAVISSIMRADNPENAARCLYKKMVMIKQEI